MSLEVGVVEKRHLAFTWEENTVILFFFPLLSSFPDAHVSIDVKPSTYWKSRIARSAHLCGLASSYYTGDRARLIHSFPSIRRRARARVTKCLLLFEQEPGIPFAVESPPSSLSPPSSFRSCSSSDMRILAGVLTVAWRLVSFRNH